MTEAGDRCDKRKVTTVAHNDVAGGILCLDHGMSVCARGIFDLCVRQWVRVGKRE